MIEFFRNNSAVIPFAIAAICNIWVGLDVIFNKKEFAFGMAYLCFTGASICMCIHYLQFTPSE